MPTRTIDHQASTVTVRTRAKGMLARLAHDLEIDATRFDGDVDVDGDRWSASLSFDVAGLSVTGALKGGRVDRSVLSASEKEDIAKRIRKDHLPFARLEVSLSGKSRDRAEITVTAGRGQQSLSVPLKVEEGGAGELVVSGELKLSLERLGVKEIKGPLGAFRVDDAVQVIFSVKLAAP